MIADADVWLDLSRSGEPGNVGADNATDRVASPAPNAPEQALVACYSGAGLPKVRGVPPRVIVVGAGVSGLVCANLLGQGGCPAMLYEASPRLGGRILTARERDFPNRVVELGAEFIDSGHADVHALACVAGEPLVDTATEAEQRVRPVFVAGGQRRTEAEVNAAFARITARITADASRLSSGHTPGALPEYDRRIDRQSVSEYLATIEMDAWLRSLIESAYTSEMGLDASRQSALNLLTMIGTDEHGHLAIYGESDERYKCRAGLDRLVAFLAAQMGPRIRREHRLVRLRRRANEYALDFATPSGTIAVKADIVVLAMPFNLLREVDVDPAWPAEKRAAIDGLAYGSNAKLLIELSNNAAWRSAGYDGNILTDDALQCGWDAMRLRAGDRAIFTHFVGGREAQDLGSGDPRAHADRYARLAERAFAGFDAARTGRTYRMHWPSEEFFRCSYSTFGVGQWERFAGRVADPVGHVYFCGEHCSVEHQGYVQGAMETARTLACRLLRDMG